MEFFFTQSFSKTFAAQPFKGLIHKKPAKKKAITRPLGIKVIFF